MHIPILISGLTISLLLALSVGAITPFLSGILIGILPLFPMMPIMIFELATYGLVVSLCRIKLNLNMYCFTDH